MSLQATAQATAEPPQPAAPCCTNRCPPLSLKKLRQLATPPASNPNDQSTGALVREDPSKLITDDPTLLTPAEIELLMRLAERRDKLEGGTVNLKHVKDYYAQLKSELSVRLLNLKIYAVLLRSALRSLIRSKKRNLVAS